MILSLGEEKGLIVKDPFFRLMYESCTKIFSNGYGLKFSSCNEHNTICVKAISIVFRDFGLNVKWYT